MACCAAVAALDLERRGLRGLRPRAPRLRVAAARALAKQRRRERLGRVLLGPLRRPHVAAERQADEADAEPVAHLVELRGDRGDDDDDHLGHVTPDVGRQRRRQVDEEVGAEVEAKGHRGAARQQADREPRLPRQVGDRVGALRRYEPVDELCARGAGAQVYNEEVWRQGVDRVSI
eukprot:1727442-Prymnesium_polylepis.2